MVTLLLKQVGEFKPDLIVIDMMMPEMDGITTLRKLKEIEMAQNIPVIFMTAKIQNHEQKSYLQEGAIGVIMKPFDPMTLCNTLSQIWQQHQKC